MQESTGTHKHCANYAFVTVEWPIIENCLFQLKKREHTQNA